jgi:hypothetical protein
MLGAQSAVKRFRRRSLYEAGVALRQLYTKHWGTGKLKFCFGQGIFLNYVWISPICLCDLFVPELAMKGVALWLVIWIHYYFVYFGVGRALLWQRCVMGPVL